MHRSLDGHCCCLKNEDSVLISFNMSLRRDANAILSVTAKDKKNQTNSAKITIDSNKGTV